MNLSQSFVTFLDLQLEIGLEIFSEYSLELGEKIYYMLSDDFGLEFVDAMFSYFLTTRIHLMYA